MSTCVIITQGDKMYIGADTACSVKTENGYQRFSNNMQKLFTIGNSVFFCSGKKQDVEKCVNWIYDSFNNSINVIELEQYLKHNFSTTNQDNIFNIEFLLCDYDTYCVTQLSQYNNFKPVKYEKSNQLRIICGGYKTKDSFFIAKDNILSKIPIKDVYNNVFDDIADECVGGNVILFDSPIHFEKMSVNEKNINYANSDNLFLLTSDFVTAGYIYGSQIISGDIYSENYKVDSSGNVIQGSHLALKDGSFNFGAGSLTYDITNGLSVKGNITSGSTITGSKFIGGSITIGENFTVDENGNLIANEADITGTIKSNNAIITGGSLTVGNNFSVDNDGNLIASNANITGTITTERGIVGGWTISDGVLYDYDGTISTVGAGMQSWWYDTTNEDYNAEISFWAGAPFKNRYLAPFLVKVDGSVVANSLSTSHITITGGSLNINNRFIVDEKGNVTLPDNASISWSQVTGTDNIATQNYVTSQGYQTASQVTQITKDTVTTSYVNALNVTAGSVAAENITGTTITGKTISGGSINIGNGVFTVSTTGAMKCTSATITGVLSASSGSSLGGFKTDSNSIYYGSWGTNPPSVFICTGSSTTYSLGGSPSTNGWCFGAGSNFGVTNTGAMYARSGKIGDWYLGYKSVTVDGVTKSGYALYSGTTNNVFLFPDGVAYYDGSVEYYASWARILAKAQ